MASVGVFALTRFTALAAGDVIPAVDISDSSQNAHGSLDAITVTNFFASIPVPVNVTSASATALAVGLTGATNSAFVVDASTALQVAGLKVVGAVTGGTVAIVATDSGADASLSINAKGAGTIAIGSVSTGAVTITPALTVTGATTIQTLTVGLGASAVATNTAIGYQALTANTTGNDSVAVGYQALVGNTTGNSNTALGYLSLTTNTTSSSNTAIGAQALRHSTGTGNTALGASALNANTTGSSNTAFGVSALNSHTTGDGNTALGYQALVTNTTGSGNVALGYAAGTYETGSNAFYVDNQDRSNTAGDKAGALLYGTFNATPASQRLRINATLGVLGQYGPSAIYGLTDGATIALDWNNGNVQGVTLGGNRTFTFANPVSGGRYIIVLTQDGTGSRTITWPTIRWVGGSAPTLTTTASKKDTITLVYDGTAYIGAAALNA